MKPGSDQFRHQIHRWFFGSNAAIGLICIGLIVTEFRKTQSELNILSITVISLVFIIFLILGRWQIKKLILAFEKSWVEIDDQKFIFFYEVNGKKETHLEILRSEDWKVLKLRHVYAFQIEAPIWSTLPFFKKTHIISIATNEELADKTLRQIFPKSLAD